MSPLPRLQAAFLVVLVLTTLLVQPVFSAQICGEIGTHNDTITTFFMGNFFFKAPTTFALCADFCKNDYPSCKSFRYAYYSDADAQYCEFFPDWLENFFIADDTQPYYYYDIDCAFPTYAVTETVTQQSTTTVTTASTTVTSSTTLTLDETTTTTSTLTSVVTMASVATTTSVSTSTSYATLTSPTTITERATLTSATTLTSPTTVTASTTISSSYPVTTTAIRSRTTTRTIYSYYTTTKYATTTITRVNAAANARQTLRMTFTTTTTVRK